MNPVEAAISDLRISGLVLLHEQYPLGNAIAVPAEDDLRALLGHGPHVKVAPFHFVLSGEFAIAPASGERITLKQHDFAIVLDGGAHQLCFGPRGPLTTLQDVLAGHARFRNSKGGEPTELICGAFAMRSLPLNPLPAALPPVLRCSAQTEQVAPLLSMTRQMLELEMKTPARANDVFTRARLLEILFAEAIRAYQASTATPVGWFRGLADARVAAALSAFHQAPAKEWSVERLAACSTLSPSRFAARFRNAIGQTAMEYVARWRIHLASRLLEDPQNSVESIAYSVGYGGGPALSKAFKDRVGCSPAVWRASQPSAP